MPTNRTPLRRERRGKITADQEMSFWLGHPPDVFANEDEARALWTRHSPRLMDLFAMRGRRPVAWWKFDAPIPYPGDEFERSALYEAGLLSPEEREQLVAEWREEFDRAQAPGFGFCAGLRPDGKGALWLTGQAARRAHHAWADIPTSLVEQWRTERVIASVADAKEKIEGRIATAFGLA